MKFHFFLSLILCHICLFSEEDAVPTLSDPIAAKESSPHPREKWPVRYRLPTRQEVDSEDFDSTDYDDLEQPETVYADTTELTLKQEIAYYFGTFVSTSPYPGVRATYFGTELMSQLSNVNKDLQILIELEKYKNFLRKRGLPYFKHPRLFLSGLVEGFSYFGFGANGSTDSDIDFSGAEIGFLLTVNPWLNSIVVLEYDNAQINLFGDRVNNSRIQMETGMIMFGDLDTSPFYATIGQTFVPFGQYTTYSSIERPLTRLLFRVLAREFALSYYNKTIQASVFTFKGGTFQDRGNNINNFGCNISYLFNGDKISGKIGAGVIRNIADSQLQLVAFNPITGPRLRHTVPGAFANANITIGPVNLLAEYLTGTRRFAQSDMAYSTNRGRTFRGALVSAVDAEIAYIFKIFNRGSTLSLGYSESWEALGFALPKRRILFNSTTNVAKGALLSFELGYNRLYNKDDRASGKVIPGNPVYLNTNNLGNSDYSIGVDFLLFW